MFELSQRLRIALPVKTHGVVRKSLGIQQVLSNAYLRSKFMHYAMDVQDSPFLVNAPPCARSHTQDVGTVGTGLEILSYTIKHLL